MKLKQVYLLYLFLFIAPTSICTIVMGKISTVIQMVLFALICLYFLSSMRLVPLSKNLKIFFASYLLPLIFSYITVHLSMLILSDGYYTDYVYSGMISRILNVLMLSSIMIGGYQIYKKNNISLEKILYAYIFGVLIFLVLFGILQILNMLVGIPIPDIGTRSHVHSMSSNDVLSSVGFQISRVTSLANEPSFLAPFLIDALILTMFLNKKLMSSLLLIVCFFTLSLGCYANICLLAVYYFYLNFKTFNLKHVFFFILLSLVIVFSLSDFLTPFINIVSDRSELSFESSTLLQSSRIYVIWKALSSLFSSNFLNILFGFGPGSFEYLSSINGYLPGGDRFYVTSNNLFVDVLYEGGIVSLILIISYFIILFRRSNKFIANRNVIFYKLLVMHLIISSMYRADFVSIRFFALVLIIAVLEERLYENRMHTS